MNAGKICVSACAETVKELVETIKRAAEFADVIELRFDCLSETEMGKTNYKLPDFKKPFLVTFRPREQGGRRDSSVYERLKFWESFLWKNSGKVFMIDAEFDISEALDSEKIQTVVSYHDFNGNFDKLTAKYEVFKLSKSSNDKILKLAAQTDDITDSIAVWKLLERAEKDGVRIVPIAMDDYGKWTRILSLAHGAFMTYAAPDAGLETAPGQISARDLIDVYRVKELNAQTKVFGIIGGDTRYSLSPYIHNEAFKFHRLNSVFVPLAARNLSEFMRRMVKPETREIDLNFRGFSVTIPHKQSIIEHLDFVDETARKIGAVNTINIEDGKLYGYNTDAQGFIEPLKTAYGDLKKARVAVLGAGGAARACVYALVCEKADVTIFARDAQKARILADEFAVKSAPNKAENENYDEFDILVNATPLGMRGKAEGETLAVAAQLKKLNLVYDLVYTPFQTRLLAEADEACVPKIGGLAMLIAQAIEQQRIWTNLDAPIKEMSRAALERMS